MSKSCWCLASLVGHLVACPSPAGAGFGGASVEVALWRGGRLTTGGSFSIDRGSRPTRYLQPHGRLILPVSKQVSWTAEWRWFGFDQTRFGFENFHTHLLSTGLRIAMQKPTR